MTIKRNIIFCLVLFTGAYVYAMDLPNKPNEAYYTDWKEIEKLCEARKELLAKRQGMKFLAEKQYVQNGRVLERDGDDYWRVLMLQPSERQVQEKAQKK